MSSSSSHSSVPAPLSLSTHPSPRVRQLYNSLQKALDSAFTPASATEYANSLGKLHSYIPDLDSLKSSFSSALRELRLNIELEFGVILTESGFIQRFEELDRIIMEQRILQQLRDDLNHSDSLPLDLAIDPRIMLLNDLQKTKQEEAQRLRTETEQLEQENEKLREKVLKQRQQVEELIKIVNREKENSTKLGEIAAKWSAAV